MLLFLFWEDIVVVVLGVCVVAVVFLFFKKGKLGTHAILIMHLPIVLHSS